MPRLKDKVAIVAGAGSIAEGWSNGKATAVLFAREGAKVFAVDRDMQAAEETCAIIKTRRRRMRRRISATSRSPSEVDAMVAACIAKYGRIDVLFNNVGMQVVGGPLEVKEEDWDRLMTVNVKSMYLDLPRRDPAHDQAGRRLDHQQFLDRRHPLHLRERRLCGLEGRGEAAVAEHRRAVRGEGHPLQSP